MSKIIFLFRNKIYYDDILIDGELMSFGYAQHEQEGCSVRTCNNHQIQTYCTKDCPSSCAVGQRGTFNLALCAWSCSCDTTACVNKGPKCPAGMKLANIVHEEDVCCPFDDEKGYTCVCDEKPVCSSGFHSPLDPVTGCHLPCEQVNICPVQVDFKECALSGGTIIRVGPCQTCHHEQCPANKCTVSKSQKRITFGDFSSTGDDFELVCSGSCQSQTGYVDSECSVCSPDQFETKRITLHNVLDARQTKEFLVSRVTSCSCSTAVCDFSTHAPQPATIADVSSSDYDDDDADSSEYY